MANASSSTQSGIVVYGTTWCGDCRRSKRLLDRHGIPYVWVDIEEQPEAASLVERINGGRRSVPTIVLGDGQVLVEPSDRQLGDAVGIQR